MYALMFLFGKLNFTSYFDIARDAKHKSSVNF